MLGRYQQIDMPKDTTSRFVEDKSAQTIIAGDPARLFPQCLARWRLNTADDHITNFAFRMTTDDVNNL